MIRLKTAKQIQMMRESCRITAGALEEAGRAIRPGLTLLELDRLIRGYIEKHGATPSFLHYAGYPASACLSVNEVVIHGIPDGRALQEGDIVSVDVGAHIHGYHGDAARTFAVGSIAPNAQKLIEVTKECFYEGLSQAIAGNRIGDISAAVQAKAEGEGFGVVRDYVGHGVGEQLHEDPEIPNFGKAGRGPRLYEGMTVAIEPMIVEHSPEVKVLKDGWTVVTCDRGLSAHYENTVAITANGPEILTVL